MIRVGVPYDEYAAMAGVRVSDLVHIARSPAHYRSRLTTGRKDTPALAIGRLLHAMVLEPDAVEQAYAVVPRDAPKRPTSAQRSAKKPSEETLAAVAFWDALEAGGRELIQHDDWDLCAAMADSLLNDPHCAPYLTGRGHNEVVATWTDPETGIACKQRNDRLADVGGRLILIDVKTTKDASAEGFTRECSSYHYLTKAGFYLWGLSVLGHRPAGYALIAVEKEPPYCAAVRTLSAPAIEQGIADARDLLRRLAEAEERRSFTGYEPAEISHPRWQMRGEFYA